MASNNSHYYDEDADDQNSDVAEDGKDERDTSATGLLPKSVFKGRDVSVGDTLTFKVTAVHDDEVQVQCQSGSEDELASDEEEASEETTGEEPVEAPDGGAAEPVSAGGGMYE